MIDRIEQAKRKISEKKQKIVLNERILKEREKRQQAKRFNEVGKIAYKANINVEDEMILLGAFLEISKQLSQNENIEKWRLSAEEFLKSQNSKTSTPITIKFKSDQNKEVKDRLKEMKFKWNTFRKEYYGYGNKREIENLLKGTEAHIEEII